MNLIKKFNPVGTNNLAQATINKGIHMVEKEIIEQLKQKLKELER